MGKFKKGTECFHKTTTKRCVVISLNKEDSTVKVHTEDDVERDYFPQELMTSEEADEETATGLLAGISNESEINPDPFD